MKRSKIETERKDSVFLIKLHKSYYRKDTNIIRRRRAISFDEVERNNDRISTMKSRMSY